MLHLLPAKSKCCLLSMIVVALLSMWNMYGWQTVSLSPAVSSSNISLTNAPDQVIKGPFHVLYEHAVLDAQHYCTDGSIDNCGSTKLFDIAVVPLFEFERVKDSNQSIMNYGAFIRAQFNWKRLWVRAYDLVGQVIETPNHSYRKSTGADDVVLKLGYDFCLDTQKHFGLYLLGSIPTRYGLNAQAHRVSDMGVELIVPAPLMGGKNFAVGGGFTGSYDLFHCDSTRMTVLFDSQYAYMIPTTYARVPLRKIQVGNEVWLRAMHSAISEESNDKFEGGVSFTPGHSLINWFALNTAFENTCLEVGGELRCDFGSKASLHIDKNIGSYKERIVWYTPSLCLNVKPYIGVSRTFFISSSCPLSASLGIAYDYNEVQKYPAEDTRKDYDIFQGFNLWATANISF